MISLRNVSYAYPARSGVQSGYRLECESLDLPAGQITVICGPNGGGKTTLLRLLCGVLRPDRGQLLLNGEDATKWPLGRIGTQVGFLLQEPSHQLFQPQVLEEMTLADRLKGRDPEQSRIKAEALLKEFGLWQLRERSVLRLSRGEKQRLALAALLMGEARFLLLDEPTTGLDADNRALFYAKVEELARQGLGIAVASHDPELLRRWQQHCIRVEQGRVYDDD